MVQNNQKGKILKKSKGQQDRNTNQKTDTDPNKIDYYVAVNDSLCNLNSSGGEDSLTEILQIKLSFKDPVEIEHMATDDMNTPLKVPDNPTQELASTPQIHEDVQSVLEYIYYQNGMTVISEETSKQYTEITYGQNRLSENHQSMSIQHNNMTVQSNFESSKFSNGIVPSKMDDKIQSGVYFDRLKRNEDSEKSRLAKSTQSAQDSRTHWETDSIFLEKYSISEMKKKNIELKKKKTDQSEPKEPTANVFLKKKQKANKSKVHFKKVKKPDLSSLEKKTISMTSFIKKSDIELAKKTSLKSKTDHLPAFPEEPQYEITCLQKIKSNSDFYKKKSHTSDAKLKLKGEIMFHGSLVFGKLDGLGCLLKQKTHFPNSKAENYLLYEGQFKDNEVQGKGVLYFQNGGTFEGGFKGGKAHGFGKLKKNDGNVVIEGVWINGLFC